MNNRIIGWKASAAREIVVAVTRVVSSRGYYNAHIWALSSSVCRIHRIIIALVGLVV